MERNEERKNRRTRTGWILIALLVFASTAAEGCSLFKRLKEEAARLEAGAGFSSQPSGKTQRMVMKTLKNRMRVVARHNPGAPVVAVQLWVNTGSADERDEEAGIAHLIEHMMFKGTKERPRVGQTAEEVESLGGDLNAFTSYDHTVYHITIASRYYREALDLLSDLVLNPLFDPEELAKEKEVVLEEIRRSNDNPRSRIYKYLFENAYAVHSYRRPVIGFEDTVKSFTRDDLLSFYRAHYRPDRMVLVVAGDVDPEAAAEAGAAEFQKAFSAREQEETAENPRKTEPPQKEPRVGIKREEVSEGYLYLGFHIPPYAAEDMPALDLLSVILGEGETSRLVHRIRTVRRLVNNIWSYAYTPKDPGMFLIGADLDQEKLEQAVDMILKQIFLLKHEEVEPWELEKAKLAIQTDEIYARETVDGQARRLGFNLCLTGNPEYHEIYLRKIKEVTPEDLKRVAAKYFTTRNLTAAAILPRKDTDAQNPDQEQSTLIQLIKKADEWDQGFQPGALTEPEPLSPPELPPPLPGEAFSEPRSPLVKEAQRYVLPNGVRLIVKENHAVPLVSLRAAFLGGLRFENRDNNGINNFIAETITEGTAKRSGGEIHSFFESRGGSIAGFSGKNSTGLVMEVPSPYFHACLPVFNEVLREPAFPEKEVERIRGIIVSKIKSQSDRPHELAFRLFYSELFHEHPFGMHVLGTEKTVLALSPEDLQDYYKKLAWPENLVIAVVGDVKAEEVKEEFQKLFADWEPGAFSPPEVPREPPPKEVRRAVECREVNQANIVIGFQGTSVDSEDRFPLEVLSAILSGMSGRLFSTLRGEQSLAYSVYAFSQEGIDPGSFGVYIGTAPEKEEAAIRGILGELERLTREPPSEEELLRAKRMLIGEFEIRAQRYRNQAARYALDELLGLGFKASDRYAQDINAVTREAVLEAARKYINPAAFVLAEVKPCGEDNPRASTSGE